MTVNLAKSNDDNPAGTSICESCGNGFYCGAEDGDCWCFKMTLSERTRIGLTQKYSKCLCPVCLVSADGASLPDYKNSQTS